MRAAFGELAYGDFPSLENMQFVPGRTQFYTGNGIVLDIMTGLKGLEMLSFDECLSLASMAGIDDVEVPFLHLNHLIEAKKAAARPKDQLDLIELEKIRQLRGKDS